MKITFTLLAIAIPFLSFSQKDNSLNYSINTAVFGSFAKEAEFQNPSGETIPIGGGGGYKIGATVLIPKRKFSYLTGLNFRQSYNYFKVLENMWLHETDDFTFISTGVALVDWVRQSYVEVPLGFRFKLDPWSSLSLGTILQLQIEGGRHRILGGVPADASLLEPLDTDISPNYFGLFLKFENKFAKNLTWDVFFQSNHDEIELPNTPSTSSYQLYLGGGINYFLTKKS